MQNEYMDVDCTEFTEQAFDVFMKDVYCLAILSLRPAINRDLMTLRMIRENSSIPIIVLSQKLSLSEKSALFHAGANVCLEKPIDVTLCAVQACSLIQLYLDAKDEIIAKDIH